MQGYEGLVGESAATFRGGGFTSMVSSSLSKRDNLPTKQEICHRQPNLFHFNAFDLATYPAAVWRFYTADRPQCTASGVNH